MQIEEMNPTNLIPYAAERAVTRKAPEGLGVQPFLVKLYNLMHSEEVEASSCVEWKADTSGTINGFLVRDTKMLENELLKRFFNSSKFATLVRQLHIYGFVKRTTSEGCYFQNPHFVYNKPEAMVNIVRQANDQNRSGRRKKSSSSNAGNGGSSSRGSPNAEEQRLRKENARLQEQLHTAVMQSNMATQALMSLVNNLSRLGNAQLDTIVQQCTNGLPSLGEKRERDEDLELGLPASKRSRIASTSSEDSSVSATSSRTYLRQDSCESLTEEAWPNPEASSPLSESSYDTLDTLENTMAAALDSPSALSEISMDMHLDVHASEPSDMSQLASLASVFDDEAVMTV